MSGRPVTPTPEVRYCKACAKVLERRRYGTGRLEDREAFMDREYCDKRCAPGRQGIRRRDR